VLLVPVFELAGVSASRVYLRRAAGMTLWLAAFTAVIAALDGWLLAYLGGYKGSLVLLHLYGGVWLATIAMLTLTLRRPTDESGGAPGWLYACGLVATVGLLVWTSHNGGSLSHGSNFLTEYRPTWLGGRKAEAKPAPGGVRSGQPQPPPKTVYAARIQPILDRSCVGCHGPEKVKGKLRLDTYAGLMAGGDDGLEIEPWVPDKSEIIRRITLPPDDDDFMPNNGKNLLTPAEIATIKAWIAAGASDKQPL
jgi:mono/diheme cytochrome c family protein